MGPRDAGVAGCPSRGRPDGGTLASFGQKAARAPQDEDGRARAEVRLIAEPFVGVPAHDVKQPISFPRRIFASGFLRLCFTHPESRGGRSAEKRSGACEAPVGRIMCVTDARERAYHAIRQALASRGL